MLNLIQKLLLDWIGNREAKLLYSCKPRCHRSAIPSITNLLHLGLQLYNSFASWLQLVGWFPIQFSKSLFLTLSRSVSLDQINYIPTVRLNYAHFDRRTIFVGLIVEKIWLLLQEDLDTHTWSCTLQKPEVRSLSVLAWKTERTRIDVRDLPCLIGSNKNGQEVEEVCVITRLCYVVIPAVSLRDLHWFPCFPTR